MAETASEAILSEWVVLRRAVQHRSMVERERPER
jgi:hypothetical protein